MLATLHAELKLKPSLLLDEMEDLLQVKFPERSSTFRSFFHNFPQVRSFSQPEI